MAIFIGHGWIFFTSLFLSFKVFDYDWGMQDDFLGSCVLDLSQLEVNRCGLHFSIDISTNDSYL